MQLLVAMVTHPGPPEGGRGGGTRQGEAPPRLIEVFRVLYRGPPLLTRYISGVAASSQQGWGSDVTPSHKGSCRGGSYNPPPPATGGLLQKSL